MDFVKKEWQFRDVISENELNRMEDGIEEGITKAEQAQDTADNAQNAIDNHIAATTDVHGATSEVTPNRIVMRDSAGRFKAAAPSASDDVARKAEVDAVVNNRKLITYTSLADLGLSSVDFDGLTTEEQFFDTVIPKMADGSQLVLAIEGNNTPINNVGRFLPGTGSAGSINGILEIVKGNNNRTSVTYQFATTSALGGAHATRYEGTFVHENVAPNRRWSGWGLVWNSVTFDPSTKFDKAGGNIAGDLTIQDYIRMTLAGGIGYLQAGVDQNDTNAKLRITRKLSPTAKLALLEIYSELSTFFGNVLIDNGELQIKFGTALKTLLRCWGGDGAGLGVTLGSGGGTVIAAGESGDVVEANNNPANEHAYISADANIYFYSGLQSGVWDDRKEMSWRNDGTLMVGGERLSNLSWVNATLQNSWQVYGSETPQYTKDALGYLHIRGRISSGSTANGTVIMTLPTGYRPSQTRKVTTSAWNGTDIGISVLTIHTNGEVAIDYVHGNIWLSLDNINVPL